MCRYVQYSRVFLSRPAVEYEEYSPLVVAKVNNSFLCSKFAQFVSWYACATVNLPSSLTQSHEIIRERTSYQQLQIVIKRAFVIPIALPWKLNGDYKPGAMSTDESCEDRAVEKAVFVIVIAQCCDLLLCPLVPCLHTETKSYGLPSVQPSQAFLPVQMSLHVRHEEL